MRETFNLRMQRRQPPCAGEIQRTARWRSSLFSPIPALSFFTGLFLQFSSRVQYRLATLLLTAVVFFGGFAANAESLSFSAAPGGIVVAGNGTAYTATFGNMNALGAGTVPPGLTAVPMSNGTLYYTPIRMTVGTFFGTAWVSAYVSSNGHPAALIGYACAYPDACTASGNYSALSTAAGSPTIIVAKPGVANNTTVTIGVGFFLPDNNGASAYTGTSNVVITFKVTNNNFGFLTQTVTLTLTTTVQTAVQLTLTTDPGGATINPGGATDYALSFGNVNGLGIGPAPGLATTAVAGGMIYHTPYQLNPAFSAFSSTTSTIKVSLSTNFAHPAVLSLEDSANGGGPYTVISAVPTTITAGAGDRSSVTRYLGLFVSNLNGPSAFTGADNATLTFTLTVP